MCPYKIHSHVYCALAIDIHVLHVPFFTINYHAPFESWGKHYTSLRSTFINLLSTTCNYIMPL